MSFAFKADKIAKTSSGMLPWEILDAVNNMCLNVYLMLLILHIQYVNS